MQRNCNPFFLIFLFFLCFNVAVVRSSIVSAPVWMQIGAYAEYKFESKAIIFLNGTLLDADTSATFRWQCIDRNETFAKLNVSILFSGETWHLHLSEELYVNMVTREVILQNGTVVGKTRLWAPAYPEIGETVFVWDNPPDRLVGNVTDVGGGVCATPQGSQIVFDVSGNGTFLGTKVGFGMLCDLNTGLTIACSLLYEATLLAFDIVSPGRHGVMYFTDTNIDLGPRDLWPEIVSLLPIAAPVVLFLIFFVSIHRRRRRRGRALQRTKIDKGKRLPRNSLAR